MICSLFPFGITCRICLKSPPKTIVIPPNGLCSTSSYVNRKKLAHLRSRGPMGCFLDAVIPLFVVIK
uniref:Uncharacterized protein n=1 Tax=Triticum urartu TaxID=4572 RepID=A0A8R7P775_TRIUA